MTIPQLVAVCLISYLAGGISALGTYYLIHRSRRGTALEEGIDGLHDALDSAGRDLPTRELPRPRPGTVYSGSHRRKGPRKWLARMGRPHPRRDSAATRHLP